MRHRSASPRLQPRIAFAVALITFLSATSPIAASAPRGDTRSATDPASVTVLIQPDANGTDTFVLDTAPLSAFGDNDTLWVGRDAATTSVARSLARFDLSSIPPNAAVTNATLELYAHTPGGAAVQVRRAAAPWTEGSGPGTTRIQVAVRETEGVPRVREPVGLRLSFAPGSLPDPARGLRVWEGAAEVPSQVYAYGYTGPWVTSATVFFGVTVDAFSTAFFNVTYGPAGTPVPTYRLGALGSTPLWTFAPVGRGASGATVVDIDGDRELEVVFGTEAGELVVLNASGVTERRVTLPGAAAIPYTPQILDMDRDGERDIVVITNRPSVFRLNRSGGVVWEASYAVGSMPYATPTLLDVNGDGILDVLIGGRFNRAEALDGTSGSVIRTYPTGDWTYTSSILDVDGDGTGELFFGSDDYFVHAYRANGSQVWAAAPASSSFLESSVAIGDVDGDGEMDIVTGDDTNVGPEFVLRASNGSLVWSRTLPSYREGGQTLVDLDGDGTLEVVVGVYGGTLYALRGADGTDLFSLPTGTQAMSPAAVDVDRDGWPDLILTDAGNTVRVVNRTGAVLHSWTITPNDSGVRTLSQKPMVTPVVADLDGDGSMEVIVPTGAGVVAYATGALGRDWRTWGYNWNHTHRAYDGSSPDGVAPLEWSVGAAQPYPAPGASWDFRDGVARWAAPGGDFLGVDATAGPAIGWLAWNVTGLVADWVGGGYPNVGLFLTSVDESSDGAHGFFSSDATDSAARPRLTVEYTTPGTAPRILAPVPDQVGTEDGPAWSLDLAAFASDNDTPAADLRWNVTGYDPAVVAVTGTNVPGSHVVTFRPLPDAWGSARVTFWLSDPGGSFDRRDGWLNLTPVNDPPTFSPPATLIVKNDLPYVFDFRPYVADVDTPAADLALSTDDPVRATPSGLNVTFLYPGAYLGQWVFVAITVSDGFASTARVVAVKVTTDTPPSVSRPLPDVTLREGETVTGVFDLDDYFVDEDEDDLYYTFGYSHLTITIRANHSVDIAASGDWNGQESVTFRASDPEGAITEDSILVNVLPTNDPPTLLPVPDLRVRFDSPYSFNLEPYIADPDTPIDGITVGTSSSFIAVSGRLLILLYPEAYNGTAENVTITVSDGASSANRTIRVTIGSDYPPVRTAKLTDTSFAEDARLPSAYNLSAFFDDPDSSTVFYSSGNRRVVVEIDAWGLVSLRAEADWWGMERVTFRATDGAGGLAEDTVWVTVISVNDAPFFRPVPTLQENTSNFYVDLTPYLGDVDSNLTLLRLSTEDPRARVVGLGLLVLFPSGGAGDVNVTVTDGELGNWTVLRVIVNLPPASERLPEYLLWVALLAAMLAGTAWVAYRRRSIEWAILMNAAGLQVASIPRVRTTAMDTDLLTAMLTAIMKFAKESFSGDTERELDDLELGDRRVAIEKGTSCYLAVVYRGHAPGSLKRVMRSLVARIDRDHGDAIRDMVDTSTLGDIPYLLQRLVKNGWWPLLSFDAPNKPS